MTLIRPLAWAALAAGLMLAAGQTAQADHPVPAGSALPGGPGKASVALALEPERPRAGEPAALLFTFADAAGRPLEELITHHGRKLHVVIVSGDMAVLGHVHPADFDQSIMDGRSRVFFTFPRAGRYLVAADFMTEAGPQAAQFLVEVAGGGVAAGGAAAPGIGVVELEPDGGYKSAVELSGAAAAGGYSVSLARPRLIRAGEPATFTWRFARAGAPVKELRPYLLAAMHLAVVKDDLSAFLHEHGTAAGQARQETHTAHGPDDHAPGPHDHGAHDHGHAAHLYDGPWIFGPEVTARLRFPEPGRYYLFGQAAHGKRVLISRFPVEVR